MAEYLARVTWENICEYRKELREGFAGGGSARLPLTDQYGSDQSALNKLKFGHLMQHFESIRTLTDDSVTRLNKLHDHVAARRTLFLSHRHHEAGSLVREVAGHLRDHALCWWDVQELPQSRRYYDPMLQDMLNDGIRQAGWFVAFLTRDYAATRWTDDEWNEAQALCANLTRGPRTLPVMLGGGLREGMEEQQPIRVGEDAEAIAAAIRERFESIN